jgi:ribosome maturation factor RimP
VTIPAKTAEEMSERKLTFLFAQNSNTGPATAAASTRITTRLMALQIETIRATADRVAASHHLDVVDLEFTGGAKHRTLRVFLEKDAATRERMRLESETASFEDHVLPKGVPTEMLSFVTHEDCASFATDFGTVLDVEELIPGAEYTLEVSSPGLERKLFKASDYTRFLGSLAKIQLFTAIDSNRHFIGRITAFDGTNITLDLAAIKQKGKAKKTATDQVLTIPLANVEKANLVAEI